MILLILTFLLVAIFFFSSKSFIYSLVVYYVLFDMFDGFYEDQKMLAAIRYLVPLILIIIYLIKNRAILYSDQIFFFFTLYLIILLMYGEGDLLISAKNLLAFLIAITMILVGRSLAGQEDFIEKFKNYNRFLLAALPIYIIAANFMNIGESYSEAFTTGYLITSRMYIFPIVIFLGIHYLISGRNSTLFLRGIDITLIIVNICIIIVNTRRTAIGMLFFALIVYTIYNRKIIFKMVLLGLAFVAGLVLSYPLYQEVLNAQLEERARIQNIDSYEEEGRYRETLYLIDHHYRNQNLVDLLFGVKLFDTHAFGHRYFGRYRAIHSDINMILYSTGIFGAIFFLVVAYHYLVMGNNKIDEDHRKLYYAFLAMFCIVLIPGRFIGTFTYAPFLMLLLGVTKWARPNVTQIAGKTSHSESHPDEIEVSSNLQPSEAAL